MHALCNLFFIGIIALCGVVVYASVKATLDDEDHWKDY